MILLHKGLRIDTGKSVTGYITKLKGDYQIIPDDGSNIAFKVDENSIEPICEPVSSEVVISSVNEIKLDYITVGTFISLMNNFESEKIIIGDAPVDVIKRKLLYRSTFTPYSLFVDDLYYLYDTFKVSNIADYPPLLNRKILSLGIVNFTTGFFIFRFSKKRLYIQVEKNNLKEDFEILKIKKNTSNKKS